jgi:pyrimidine operon attenuation protein / uracil phosphoribosyltransferase
LIAAMYAQFYGLRALPFRLTPDSRFFYPSQMHKGALAYLTYGLHKSEGFVLITGDVGTGKTMVVDYLLSVIDRERYCTCKIMTTQLTPDDTIRLVASGFVLDPAGDQKSSTVRQLETFFIDARRRGVSPVIIVDEVHNLPRASLEELRMLSNYCFKGTPLVQTFLLGQTQFRETLAKGSLEQIKQRVVASSHLRPLSASETRGYIEHRLRAVGCYCQCGFRAPAKARRPLTTRPARRGRRSYVAPRSRGATEPDGERELLSAGDVARTVARMAHQVIEKTALGADPAPPPVLLGIPTRGAPLAARLAERIAEFSGIAVDHGAIDITLYRDDLRHRPPRPLEQTQLPASGIDGRTVILVDDVLFSGRSIRAALDALRDHGRPRVVQLAVLVDRGHRQLPIRADYVGKNVPTAKDEAVVVLLSETDGRDAVLLGRAREGDVQ